MELRQLKYFVKVAEVLNFSEAARQSFISQSTLSQQVQQLESELGVPLLCRDSHSVVLTEYGEKLLPYARKAVADVEMCKTQVADVKNLMTGNLNIGITHSFSTLFSYTMKEFIETYQGIKLNVFYTSTENLLEMLRRREIDFAIAYKSNNHYEDIESHILFYDHLCAICRKDHPLATLKKCSLTELSKYQLALPAKCVQGRKWLDRSIESTNIKLKARVELNDANFLLNLVNDNQLVTVLSGGTIKKYSNLVAIPLDVEDNEMNGCVHVLKDTYQKHSMKVFVQMLRESPLLKI